MLLVSAGVACLAVLVPPAPAEGSNAAVSCATAARLAQDALPRQALIVIDAADAVSGQPVCAEQRTVSTQQVTDALAVAQDADAALSDQDLAEAEDLARQALELDSQNAAARSVLDAVEQAEASGAPTLPQRLRADWDAFFTTWLQPLVGVVLPALAVVAALMLLARVLVLAPVRWPELDDRTPRRLVLIASAAAVLSSALLLALVLPDAVAPPLSAIGWLLLVAAGLVTVSATLQLRTWAPPLWTQVGDVLAVVLLLVVVLLLLAGAEGTGPLRLAVLTLGVLAAAVGGLLGAWWLATRLRLSVTVTGAGGEDRPAAVGHVTALLYEMGASKPRGLEVPRGPDVTALDDALAAAPENTVVKAVKGLLTSLTGVTPWRAQVETDPESGRLTVTLSRNGHGVDSAVIEAESLGLPVAAKEPAAGLRHDSPHRLVAAFILATMAQQHPSVRDGLPMQRQDGGPLDWRSLGLQYIAVTDLSEEDPAQLELRQRLLGAALRFDQRNAAAQLALRHSFDRASSDHEVLAAYGTWLEGYAGDTWLPLALRLRARYTQTIMLVNRAFASPPDPGAAVQAARGTLTVLLQQLGGADVPSEPEHSQRLKELQDMQPFPSQVHAATRPLQWLLAVGEPAPEGSASFDPKQLTPVAAYNLACYLATRHCPPIADEPGEVAGDDARAVTLLQRAASEPRLATWLGSDPQLEEFRTRRAYRDAFTRREPRSDVLAVPTVRPHATALTAAGLGTTSGLEALSADPSLAPNVTRRPGADDLLEAGALLHSLASSPLARLDVELVHALANRGLASRAALRALQDTSLTVLAGQLAAHLVEQVRLRAAGFAANPLTSDDAVRVALGEHIRTWLAGT